MFTVVTPPQKKQKAGQPQDNQHLESFGSMRITQDFVIGGEVVRGIRSRNINERLYAQP